MIKSLAKQILPKSLWRTLRSKRINQMIKSFDREIREGDYGGYQLKVSIEDESFDLAHVGSDWAHRRLTP